MMPPKDKRNCCGSVSQDRLSGLPGDVIDDILLRLPLRDTVSTSILSKKWRYNWCRLPELTLDHTLLKTTTSSGDPSVILGKVIDSILSLHARPITKLTLLIPCLGRCPKIDNLIHFLSGNDIQHLVLRGLFKDNPYMLPSSFFSCLQLKHLTLQKCLISPPPTFKGFDCLISLELDGAKVCYKFLESFISNCPLLEHLVLKISHDILSDVIEINAPQLKCFDFKGMLRSICLKNVPLLSKVSLEQSGVHMGKGNCDIAKYFGSSTAIETLHLDCSSFEFFTAGVGKVPARPPFILDGVKHLGLSKIYLCCLKDVSCALCLIRCFPYLQNMEIKVDGNNYVTALEHLEVESFPDMSFSHLREVKLEGDLLREHGMLFIKLVLAKSPDLVKMLLKPYFYEEESEAVELLRERLSEFQYASPEVEVVYNMIPKGTAIFRQMLEK